MRWTNPVIVQCVTVGALMGVAFPVLPQTMRDPTQPPRIGPNVLPGATTASEGLTVMVREGKPHLVVGTRWYAVGESVGSMRIDRITETEVWLHDGNNLVKTPRFTGISRSVSHCDDEAPPPAARPTADAPSGGTIHKKSLASSSATPAAAPSEVNPAGNSVKCTP